MTVTEVRSPERPTAVDAALVASLKRPRYEIFPLDGVEEEVARHIPAEVKLTITASPSGSRVGHLAGLGDRVCFWHVCDVARHNNSGQFQLGSGPAVKAQAP